MDNRVEKNELESFSELQFTVHYYCSGTSAATTPQLRFEGAGHYHVVPHTEWSKISTLTQKNAAIPKPRT